MRIKVVKVTREFSDGSKEYIDGKDVENFVAFEGAAYSLVLVHGIKQDKIEWKKVVT
jgi:hypothetical protein